MKKMKILSILVIIYGFSQCGSLKLEENPPFKITSATYTSWVGGLPGVSGKNVKIVYTSNKDIEFDSIYFSKRKAKLEINNTKNQKMIIGHFNTSTGKYKTLTYEEVTINVLKGENQDLNLTSSGNKEDVELLSNEIRHIRHETELTPLNAFFFGTTNYYLALGSSLLLFILFFFIKRKTGEEKNEAELTHKNASKSALARLSKAEGYLKHNNDSEYFEELHNAIDGYLSHKFKIPVSELNKKRIEQELTKISIDIPTITALLKVLNDCEMARFAPLSRSDAETTLTTTKTLINKIEKHVKK